MSLWPLRQRRPVPKPAGAPPQPQRRVYAVGDIHGCLSKLHVLLDRIEADLGGADADADILFLGDYVDRGDDSAGVLALLHQMQRASPTRVHCLLGNHDALLLQFLDDPAATMRWLEWGGAETLASFGVRAGAGDTLFDRLQGQAAALGAEMGPELHSWLAARPLWWRSGDLIGVHALTDPTRAMEDQTDDWLLWERPGPNLRPREDGAWVVHGHTIVPVPLVRASHVSIDTGAFSGGPLTAAVFDGGAPRFLFSDPLPD